MFEVEGKFSIVDPEEIRRRLEEAGAECLGKKREEDLYFNAPHRDYEETDEALRIRFDGDGWEITYKGPKIMLEDAKARVEKNISVKSGDDFSELFELLGFMRSATVVKKRETWHYCGATVTIDEVYDLGDFVEIEFIVEDLSQGTGMIGKIKGMLGIDTPVIHTSYLEMLLSKSN